MKNKELMKTVRCLRDIADGVHPTVAETVLDDIRRVASEIEKGCFPAGSPVLWRLDKNDFYRFGVVDEQESCVLCADKRRLFSEVDVKIATVAMADEIVVSRDVAKGIINELRDYHGHMRTVEIQALIKAMEAT